MVDKQLALHGALSFVEIPAIDAHKSAAFYESVVGWRIDRGSASEPKFSDRAGNLIGRWNAARAVAREGGFLPYIYVERIDDAVARVASSGGEVVNAVAAEGDLWIAKVRDPAGNLIGLWQAQEG